MGERHRIGLPARVAWARFGEGVLVVALIAGVGWLDYVTGPDFSIILFYSLLIAWIGWRADLRISGLAACLLTGVWALVNIAWGPPGPGPGLALQTKVWNALMVLGVLLAFAWLLNRMRRAYEEQRGLNAQLQAALDELQVLEGLVPICAWCKSIRTEAGHWVPIESYLARQSPAQLTHSICPTCAQKVSG